MKTLVTGASGFIGRHALPVLLKRDHEVWAVNHKNTPPGTSTNIKWRSANLFCEADRQALINEVRPDALLHFAWCAEHGKFWTDPENYRWVSATMELVRLFKESGGRRVTIAGTCAEYDWSGNSPLDENNSPLIPVTSYGVAKDALRRMLEDYANSTGLSLSWGRVFFTFGPNEPPEKLASLVIRSLLNGSTFKCKSGDKVRDFLSVQEVAEAFVALLESNVSGSVNIASGKPISVGEFTRKVGDRIGHPEMIHLSVPPNWPEEAPYVVASVKRLADEVGWRPSKTVEERIDLAIEYWRSQQLK